jgi:hypothetical protein
MRSAISFTVTIADAPPASIAACGIDGNNAASGRCANTVPSHRGTTRAPCAPSSSIPDSTTATVALPKL